MRGGFSEEVVSDEGVGHIHICDQRNQSYKGVVFHEGDGGNTFLYM